MIFAILVVILFIYSKAKGPDLGGVITDEFIESLNKEKLTWTAGRNFPKGTTLGQLRSLCGSYMYNSSEIEKYRSYNTLRRTKMIPNQFDSREKWPECKSLIDRVRSQGRCSGCWAVAAVAVMSDRECIQSKGRSQFEYSAEDLISCCPFCSDNFTGCQVGYAPAGWMYWKQSGLVSGGDYKSNQGCKPYSESAFKKGKPPRCESVCTNGNYSIPYHEDKHFGRDFAVISRNVKQIQAEIMTNGPVQAHMTVYDDFTIYQEGIYRSTKVTFLGAHSVKLIGWGVEENISYWLAGNIWGKRFGSLGGYFKIVRGENHCDIEKFVIGGSAKATTFASGPVPSSTTSMHWRFGTELCCLSCILSNRIVKILK